MNAPADQIFGSPTFHYRVQRLENGTYRCTNESLRQHIDPVEAPSESEAINAAKAATEAWVGKGSGSQGK